VIARHDVDELHRDAQLVARAAHAAFDYRVDTKLLAHLAQVHAGPAKLERAAAA
jgi:hypothetical protein